MDDSADDFEPLFDYSRVQHSDFGHCDYDSDTPSSPPQKRVHEDLEVITVADDEDWLPPPPKVVGNGSNRPAEDSIIQALREKKQELSSVAESAKNLMREADESVEKGGVTSIESSIEVIAKQPSKPAIERTKVVISLQDKEGQKQFRVYMDDKFERLFRTYAERFKLDPQSLVFVFDGDKISPSATPADLGMEDDDMIEVHMKRR